VLKQLILVVALLFSVARADALEYTDVYYNPAEPGWGLFLVQSDTTQFVALFIYGTDNKPTWYTAVLAQDAAGNYNGQLYATTGTYFGSPWNPAQSTEATVGTIAFNPTNIYRGTVTYALAGGPTAPIVVIPTAGEDSVYPFAMHSMLLAVTLLVTFFVNRGPVSRYWKWGVSLYSIPFVIMLAVTSAGALKPKDEAKEPAPKAKLARHPARTIRVPRIRRKDRSPRPPTVTADFAQRWPQSWRSEQWCSRSCSWPRSRMSSPCRS